MRQFTIELEELNQKLLDMGGLVETAINRSVRALIDPDKNLAGQVIQDHRQIVQLETEIEGIGIMRNTVALI